MAEDALTALEMYTSCVCLGLQRAARNVARHYDEALRPTGLTSGQFTILSSLLRDKPMPLGALAELLGLDRTTLNRNLRPLEAEGLVATVPDPEDARVRGIELTPAGHGRLDIAVPLWRRAQSESNAKLDTDWQQIRPVLARLS